MKNYTRNAVLALFSCIICGLSFIFIYSEKSNGSGFAIEAPASISIYGDNIVEIKKKSMNEWVAAASSGQMLFYGDSVRTADKSEAVVEFVSKAVVRMNEKTEFYIEPQADTPKKYSLNIVKGELWINTAASSYNFDVKIGKTTISAADSVFDVSKEDQGVSLRVISGDVRISTDSELTVSPGNQIVFNADYGAKLDYFNQTKINSDWMHGDWYSANISKDAQYNEAIAKELSNSIQSSSLNYGLIDSTSFLVSQYLENIKSFLIFSEIKKKELNLSFISKLIDDGIYYLSVDNKQAADDMFGMVLNISKVLPAESLPDFKSVIFDKFNKLKIFTRKYGNLYIARNRVRDLFFGTPIYNVLSPYEKDHLTKTFLFDAVSDLLNPDAQNLILSYFRNLFRSLRSDKKYFEKYLKDNYQVVYSIMLDKPAFYRKDIFALKSELENMLPQKDQNSFVNERVQILKNIKEFVLDERLLPRDALAVTNFINEELKGKDTTAFSSDLEKLQDFTVFLSDRNYTETSIYGDTMSDRYVSYLTSQREKLQLDEFKKSLKLDVKDNKNEISNVDTDRIKKSIVDAFGQYGIKIEEFGDISGENAKYVAIKKAVKDDVIFSAKYNRDSDTVSEIKTEADYEFPFAVRPDKLGSALSTIAYKNEFAAAPVSESADQGLQSSSSSAVEMSAKSLVAEKLNLFGIKVNTAKISVINIITKEFRVSEAEINAEKEKITISFDFKDPFTEVSNIELKTAAGFVKYEDSTSIPLQELVSKMTKFAEKAYYDQLDKELEKSKSSR